MSYAPDKPPAETADEFHAYVLREFKKISAEFLALSITAPPPLPNPDLIWQWNAEAVAPFSIQARDPSRVSLVIVGGRKWVRLLTMPGDSSIAGSGSNERTDMQYSSDLTNGQEGRERWMTHSIMFPGDYVDPPPSPASATPWNFGVVFDWHNSALGAGQANMQIQAMPVTGSDASRPTGLGIKMAWGTQAAPQEKYYPIGPIVRNVPYNFKHHVFWTAASTGSFDAWVNGRLVMQYKGPTLYAGQETYCKLARYGSPTGQPCAVLHGRLRLGKTEASVA